MTTKTKAGLIAWLKQQDLDKEYDYDNVDRGPTGCAIRQYLFSIDDDRPITFGATEAEEHIWCDLDAMASVRPWTFGAFLERLEG